MKKQQFANYEDKKTRISIKDDKNFSFGVVSDTHLGSKHQQITHLKRIYKMFKEEGAEFVLHAGDLVDGESIYRGQPYEQFLHGYDEQLEYAVANYPNELPTYLISGNHDLGWFVKGGADVCKAIGQQRPDMHYLGQLGAYVYFGGVKAYIVHRMGSPAYALSYKAQKLVEGFSTENKPQMLVIGHFHTSFQAFIRNVYVMHPSSFQGQTPFLRRMALFPVIGGYHIKVVIGDRGIARLQFEFIPLYKPLAKDY